MPSRQRLPISLTPLDVALAALLDGLEPVAPHDLPLAKALGCIAAETSGFPAHPEHDVALVDGWAVRAYDLVGASSYSPLAVAALPTWVEAGDAIPDGCDCVIDSDSVQSHGAIFRVLAEALPGQGVRRSGGDVGEGSSPIVAGRRIRALDLVLARAAGINQLSVRRPKLCVVDVVAKSGAKTTAQLIAESACEAGASVIAIECDRDAPSMVSAFDAHRGDFLIMIGGSGVGRTDATARALASREALLAHGIALQPGRTTAIGKLGNTPIIALPGAPDQALAAWWTLALPVLDRLSKREPRQTRSVRLSRKIASGVGMTEIVLLKETGNAWMPLAIGDLSLDHIAGADAWLTIPGSSEGFAAGALVNAYMLRDHS